MDVRLDDMSALALQIAWGADEALDEMPVDRTRPVARPAPRAPDMPRAEVAREMGSQAAVPPRITPVAQAEQLAEAASSIAALREALAGFAACPLAATATNLVFSDGNTAADIILVGEVPGPEEDLAGKPFAGPAGQLLDRMLASIGLDRTQLLLTMLVPWRPPGNRPPTESEVQMCLPFLKRHLALARPRIVVSFGALATRALTGNDSGIRRLRGKWRALPLQGGGEARLLPMWHPAYLRSTPAAKREAWADLLSLKAAIAPKE